MLYNNNNGDFQVAPPNSKPDPYSDRVPNFPNYGNQVAQQAGKAGAEQIGQKFEQSAGSALDSFRRQANDFMGDPEKRRKVVRNQLINSVNETSSFLFQKDDILSVGEVDQEVWKIVSDVQSVPSPCSWILAFINLFLPGFGTMISSFFGSSCSKTQFAVGLIQLSLTPILVGYPISWYWAYLIIKKSISSNDDDDDDDDSFQNQKAHVDGRSDKYQPKHQQFQDENKNNEFQGY